MQKKLWNKDYVFLLLTTIFAGCTYSSFTTVFPLYIKDLGGNNTLTGAMMSGLVISGVITRMICGKLMDKEGRKKILVIGSIMFSLNHLAYCFITNISGIFCLRVFSGVSQGFYFGAAATLVADITPNDRLIDGIGYFGIAGSLAAGITPSISLSIYNRYGSNTLFRVIFMFSVIGVLFAVLIKNKYGFPQKEKMVERNKYQKKELKLSNVLEKAVLIPAIICFFIYFGYSAVVNFITVCGVERGVENIGLFFIVNNIAVIIARLLAGKFSTKYKVSHLINGGILLTTTATIIIAVAYNLSFFLIAAILLGIGFALSTQLLNASIYKLVGNENRGTASSTYALFSDLGNGIGASFFGGISESINYMVTYLLAGFFVFIAFIINKLKYSNK